MMRMIDVKKKFKLSLFQREKDRSRCTAWLCKKPNSEEVKMYNLQLGDLSEEKYGIIWEFFPSVRPPIPPIWEASVQKKFKGLFCVLGP